MTVAFPCSAGPRTREILRDFFLRLHYNRVWQLAIFAILAADPYQALRARQYDVAVAEFEKAIAEQPARANLRKDLAYTLLKIGENESARDQFGEAMRLDPLDQQAALEFGFLCYETNRRPEARRVFDRVRRLGNATAEQAFQNIDRPLAEGIARWRRAVELTPDSFSAHEELARLADEREEFPLAAEHYERAWRLKPEQRSLLLDLGRIWKRIGRNEDANAALLAASRGAQPRVAERARELSPKRYPFVYEFQRALELDPPNLELRRELAYLLLAMGQKDEAERQFKAIVAKSPDDLLSVAQIGFLLLARKDLAGAAPLLDRVLKNGDEELADRVRSALKLPQNLRKRTETPRERVSTEAKELAEKSLKAGYLKDALKYLVIAHEADPVDFSVMLKLGWTYNVLRQDGEAVKWFNLARRSPDPAVAGEADRAYHNLAPALARFRTTAWTFPFYSSRWRDVFSYGQVKTDFRIANLPLRPYISTRFIGDTRGTMSSAVPGIGPQDLSESSVILGFGLATRPWRGAMGWFEAGESMRYRGAASGSMTPDYRGGISFSRGFGHLLTPSAHGLFAETNEDGVYVSRFQHDFLVYSQNRAGYTLRASESLGLHAQLFWNWNVTVDSKSQYWANYVETGPGVRFRFAALPPALLFTVNAMRGSYLIMDGNPQGPNFYDLRVGFWYAFTH
jgi:Flp pilus assembly protein TadD